MLEGTTGWFGAQSTNVQVIVGLSAPEANVYFIHTDHLNTPRLVANSSGTTVWRWDQQEPFGVNAPDENPSSLGTFEFPLRFPGQYFDKETNLYYNYFRDYDPGIGRYVQSDPIGLRGGLNTYAYVAGQPLTAVDPYGLNRLTDRLINEIAEEIGPAGVPAAQFGKACGKALCAKGAAAGAPGSDTRSRWTLKLCEPATALMPLHRGSDPVLECIEICDKIANRCWKIENGQIPRSCPT
jgi:RHS repeat-associated protein